MNLNCDFAVFIPSFGRANNVVALQMLKRYNYNGNYYIVCSTDDKQLEDYKQNYKNHVLVFRKEDYIKECDTMYYTNNPIMSTPLYARNFIIDKAKELNLKYFAMIDDDISKVNYRHVDSEGIFRATEIKDITNIFVVLCDFLEQSPRLCGVCPAISSGFFGGKNGQYKKGFKRLIYQFYLLKVEDVRKFNGVVMENRLYSFINFDKVYLCYYHLDFVTPDLGTNEGGNDYNARPWDALFLKMNQPSGIQLIYDKKRKYKQYNNKILPKIISDKFKK